MLKIGVIGYGNRINDVISCLMKSGEVRVAAVADEYLDEEKKSFIERNGHREVAYYKDARQMLESLDGVCIGTRCSSHTKYMLLCAEYGLPTFLEKPVCTTYEDLHRLKGIVGMNDKVVVSFPLRYSRIVSAVKEIVDRGDIGKVQHVEAINNVPYARGYYHKWYRDEKETGGLFLQKATHDLDYVNYLVGDRFPVTVAAMESKQIFKGDKPEGMLCADCKEAEECPESPQNVKSYGDGYVIGPYCCFAKDTGNQDSGSVLVMYNDGMHVAYTQNFIVRQSGGRRGAILSGYNGTLEFDMYRGEIKVFHHTEDTVDTYNFSESGAHHGGDDILAKNFIGVMKGTEASHSTLNDGILSAELCLAATVAAKEKRFVEIEHR